MIETQVPVTELEQLYTLRKADEVLKYIGENPFLIPLLKSAPEHIRQYFPGAPLILELFVDFDNLSYRYLTILIQSSYPVAETKQRLDNLLNNWWLEAMYDNESKVSINIEFI